MMTPLKRQRAQQLAHILHTQFKGVIAELARALDLDANYTRFLLYPEKPGGRWMGEVIARRIEERLNLPLHFMDTATTDTPVLKPMDRENLTILETAALTAVELAICAGALTPADCAALVELCQARVLATRSSLLSKEG